MGRSVLCSITFCKRRKGWMKDESHYGTSTVILPYVLSLVSRAPERVPVPSCSTRYFCCPVLYYGRYSIVLNTAVP